MDLEITPGLTPAERATFAAYQEAHILHAGSILDAARDAPGAESGKAAKPGRAIDHIEEAYSRVEELAPPETPGRSRGASYEALLSLLRYNRLGDTSVVRPSEPSVTWHGLPEARLLAFCTLDLMHYSFLTVGALDHAAGHRRRERLYDIPESAREEMDEEEIAGAHGDRSELERRLWRLLERSVDDGEKERRRGLRHLGYNCGSEALIFLDTYAGEPDYVEGFVEGCLERIREDEDEELTHPDDVTADQFEGMWRDPGLSEEDRRETVLELLLADCEVHEDEGELWRL